MISRTSMRRGSAAALGTAVAVLAVSCALTLTGCASGMPYSETAPQAPLPSPTGTWSPAPTDAPDITATPAPAPTENAGIDDDVEFDTGVTVSVSRLQASSVTAQTPGEVSGPAVIVELSIANGSTAPVDLDSAVVTLTADGGAYGVGTTAGDPHPFKGDLAPGKTATGRYIFMLNPAQGRSVTISVNYGAGQPVAVFTGKTS